MKVDKVATDPQLILTTTSQRLLVFEYAKTLFKQSFGYAYNGTSTIPPDAASPPNLSADDDIITFGDGKQAHVDDFMKTVLAAQKLPDWIQGQAQGDLLNWTKDLVNVTPKNAWLSRVFSKEYAPPNEAVQNTIKTDAVLVFINASLTVSGKTYLETVVCYVGVYYAVVTRPEIAKMNLRMNAYQLASAMVPDITEPITDDKTLAVALESYAKGLFKDHFNYNYGDNPPDYHNDGSLKAQASALGYFEDGNTDSVNDFVRNTLLKGIALPAWTSEAAISAIVQEFTDIITTQIYNGSWVTLNVNTPYNDQDGDNKALNVNAVTIYCLNAVKIYQGQTVKISYVFWLGTIYETALLAKVVYKDLIKQLFGNLHNSITTVPTSGINPDRAGLIVLLSRCAAFQFNTEFGYAFDTKSIRPPDSNGDEVYAVECFGEFQDARPQNISQWTKDQIFKDNTFSFFATDPALKSKLDDQIVYWLTRQPASGESNNWGISANYDRTYSDPVDPDKRLRNVAVTFYVDASLTESGYSVKRSFFYYAGVHYVANYDDDGGEV